MFRLALISLFLVGVAFAAQPKLQPEIMKEPYITGGSAATSGQFPWQVSLRNTANSHFCGGSIVNAQWVLTAAHCTIDSAPSGVRVYVGSHLLSAGIRHDVTTIRNHPSYNAQTISYDVAVLRVSPNIALNSLAQAIPLINRVVDGERLEVSGWGRTSSSGPIPTNLQWIYTNAISLAECQRQISPNPDNVCAFNARNVGICFGDSGGPLVKRGEGQVGVNSFVVGSCGQGYPDGFSSVRFHRTWIINNTS